MNSNQRNHCVSVGGCEKKRNILLAAYIVCCIVRMALSNKVCSASYCNVSSETLLQVLQGLKSRTLTSLDLLL